MLVRHAFSPVRTWRSRSVVGAAVAAVVLAGVIQGTPAQAAPEPLPPLSEGAFESSSDEPVPVPAAEPADDDAPAIAADEAPLSPAVPDVPVLPDYPEDRWKARDLTEQNAALAKAARTGKPVEIESQTTETTISHAQPDGTVQVQSSAGPVRTEVRGEWVDVDTTLEFTDDGVQPVAVTGDITFSAGGDAPMAVLGDGDTTIRMDWDGELPKPVLDGSTATYRNVFPQVDLVLTATRVGFEQHVVVKQRPGRATLRALRELEFPMDTRGAAVREGNGGQLVVEADGEVVGTAAAPLMWDARIDPASDEPVALEEVGLELAEPTERGTDATLVLSPDQAFLTDPATVYPVTIDPTAALGLLGDTFVQNNIANTPQGGSGELRVGSYNGGAQVDRSLLLFDASPAFDRAVQSATLSLYEFHSSSCSPRWVDIRDAGWFDPNTVTWNSQPWIGGIVGNANVALGYSSACPANWVNFNLTGWVQHYSDARNDKDWPMPLAVTAGSESDPNSWKKFSSANAGGNVPTLSFTYDGNCDQYHGNAICGPIRDKWETLGRWNSFLGLPTTPTRPTDGNTGQYQNFQGGVVFWSASTGAHTVTWPTFDTWASMSYERGPLGFPVTDTAPTSAGDGHWQLFQGGRVFYSDATGAHALTGPILDKWAALDYERGLGYPLTDTAPTTANDGQWQLFTRGRIFWSPSTGAHSVTGPILDKWAALDYERGLGFPMTDTAPTTARDGQWQLFTRGRIFQTQAHGAHQLVGPVLEAWAAMDYERSFLGYPTSDPLPVAGGTRQEFEGGNIVVDERSGTTTVGAGVLKNPTQFQRVTQARTQLKAAAKVRPGGGTYDRVTFQWRPYSLAPSDTWTDIDPSDLRTSSDGAVTPVSGTWLPVKDEDGGKASDVFTWNATKTIPNDGLMQVRGCLHVAGGSATDVRCTGVTQITVDRAGLTGANSTADAGPGTVSLLTGAYAVTGRDADVAAPHGGLAATRSFTSNAPDKPGPLGPGWRLSLAVDEAGADYQGLTDRTQTVLITRADGSQLPFLRKSSAAADVNNYVAEGEASTEGWTLTFDPGVAPTAASYVLKDIDGDKVTFRRADGGTGHADGGLFRVEKVEALRGKAGSTETAPAITTVAYTAGGNPRWLLAPTDAGAACADPTSTTQPAGCRALEFVYTATATGERLQQVKLWATGAAAGGAGVVSGDTPVQAQQVVLADYTYDGAGRLSRVTDPRTGIQVGYTYRADGRLATIIPAGAAANWSLGYDSRSLPRLTAAVLDDVPDTGLAAQQTSIRYDLPRDGSTDGLPSLASTEVARWGQKVTPTDLTAVFDAATVPDATPTATQWRGATLYALDVNGRVVNTGNFGGTADQDTGAAQDAAWRIGTTEYDEAGKGNVVRSLTAGNRDRALAAGADAAAEAVQARLLDTVNVYSADGMDLLRSYGPARTVVTADGTRQASARTRTTTTYDAKADHPEFDQLLHLPVRTVVDAVEITTALPAGSTGTEDGLPALDGRSRVTTLEYGSDHAWRFGTPTATRVTPGGGAAEVVTRQVVDEWGRTTSSTLPSGGTSTNTAATTVKVFYSAANTDPQCKSEAWAGWLCKSVPGGAPTSGAALPSSHVTGYDVYGNPTRTVETAPGITRTTDVTYDAAGRVRRSSTTGSGAEVGQLRPAVETTYTAAGLVEQTRVLTAAGAVGGSAAEGTGAITRSYDAYGRLVSYTDGNGLVTTYAYDRVGRPSTVSNAQGSRTVSYDGGGERGSLPTSVEVSDVGTFTARYGADGTLVTEAMPGGMTATTIRDAGGDPVSLTYRKKLPDGTVSEWLRSTAATTGFDQVDSYRTVTANGTARATRYGYDGLGRLTTATDTTAVDGSGLPSGPSCTRSYAFDVNSNRTGLTQAASAGAPGNTCPATIPASDGYAYDSADRLQPTGARAALRYDGLGRTRVLPSVDTVGAGGDVALDYFVDDLVASMTQAGRTTTFGLDATARRTVRTDTDVATPGVSRRTTSFYTGDDDNPDVVQEPDNSFTRNVLSFGGLVATVTKSGTAGAEVTLQLADLHGDVAATVPMNAASPTDLKVNETTEYGVPRVAPATGTAPARYSWLGSHQRDASTPGGLILMGVRLYVATIGRFLSVDPVEGGSANDYEYGYGDPVNKVDTDGRSWGWIQKKLRSAAKVVSKASSLIGLVPFCGVCSAASLALGVAGAVMDKAGGGSWKAFGKSMLNSAVGVALGGFGRLPVRLGKAATVYNNRARYQGVVGAAERAAARPHPLHSARTMKNWAMGMHFASNGITLAMGRL